MGAIKSKLTAFYASNKGKHLTCTQHTSATTKINESRRAASIRMANRLPYIAIVSSNSVPFFCDQKESVNNLWSNNYLNLCRGNAIFMRCSARSHGEYSTLCLSTNTYLYTFAHSQYDSLLWMEITSLIWYKMYANVLCEQNREKRVTNQLFKE